MKTVESMILCCSCTALVLNSLLIPMICFRSSKDIGNYKYLLLLYTTVELFYSAFTIMTIPVFQLSTTGWLFHATIALFPQFWSGLVIFAFTSCYLLLSIIITYSFMFRYFIFCRKHLLKWFHEPKRVAVLGLILFGSVSVYEVEAYYFFHPSPYLTGIFRDVSEANLSVVAYLAVMIFTPDGKIYAPSIVTFVMWSLFISICMSIIVFVIRGMMQAFRTMERNNEMSTKIHQLQKTLFRLLLLQTAVPAIFSFIPVVTSYILPYLGIPTGIFNDVYSILLPLSQLIDPILITLYIKEYRMTVAKFFNLCRGKPVSDTGSQPKISFMPTSTV